MAWEFQLQMFCCKTAGVQLGRVYLKWHLLASQSRQQLVVRREL